MRALSAATLAFIALAQSAMPGEFPIRAIWFEPYPAIGIEGATLSFSSMASLSESGNIVAQKDILGAGFDSFSRRSLWLLRGRDDATLLVQAGRTVFTSGEGTLPYTGSTLPPAIDRSDRVVFGGNVRLSDLQTRTGVFTSASGFTDLLTYNGREFTGEDGVATAVVSGMGPLWKTYFLNKSGQLAYWREVHSLLDSRDTFEEIRTGSVSGTRQALTASRQLGRRHNAPGVRGADFRGFTEFRLNDDGEILLSASLTSTIPDFKSWPLGLWFGAPEALSLVALGDQQAPDLSDGVTYGEFQLNGISLANQNRIAFATKVRGPGTTEKNNLCLFAGSGEGEIRLVYREGSPLPGFPDAADVDYAGFNFAVCDSGRVVMQMTDGIYAWEDGELSSIAREGDAAPGFPDYIINNFAAQQPVIDPSGRIAFGATLRDLERERNTKAVYIYDGSLRVAAGRASRIDLGNGEIAVVSSADIVNSHITNNSDGRSSSYNSRGQLLIRAATAKGSCDAIVETDLGVDGLHNVIRATIYSAGDMVIAFETEFGKRYLVERSLDGRTWEAVGGESEGNGSELTIVDEGVGAITKVAFYRIVIRSV